eukprot:4881-Heterococcus_DN1.PRE.2
MTSSMRMKTRGPASACVIADVALREFTSSNSRAARSAGDTLLRCCTVCALVSRGFRDTLAARLGSAASKLRASCRNGGSLSALLQG